MKDQMSRIDMKWISQNRAMQLEDVFRMPYKKKGFVDAQTVMKIVVCAFQW